MLRAMPTWSLLTTQRAEEHDDPNAGTVATHEHRDPYDGEEAEEPVQVPPLVRDHDRVVRQRAGV